MIGTPTSTASSTSLAPGETYRVSVATGGAAATGGASETPGISPDGRFIVFSSLATNLATGANGFRQVFLHERLAGTTRLMSESSGQPANADAVTPVVGNNVQRGVRDRGRQPVHQRRERDVGHLRQPASRLARGRTVRLASHVEWLRGSWHEHSRPRCRPTGSSSRLNRRLHLSSGPTRTAPTTSSRRRLADRTEPGSVIRVSVARTRARERIERRAAISADLGNWTPGTGGDFYDWRYYVSYTSAASTWCSATQRRQRRVHDAHHRVVAAGVTGRRRPSASRPVPLTTRVSLDGGGGQLTTASGISSLSARRHSRRVPSGRCPARRSRRARASTARSKGVTGRAPAAPANRADNHRAPPVAGASRGRESPIRGSGLDNPDVALELDVALEVRDAPTPGCALLRTRAVSGTSDADRERARRVSERRIGGHHLHLYRPLAARSYGPAPAEQVFTAGAQFRERSTSRSAGLRLGRSDGCGRGLAVADGWCRNASDHTPDHGPNRGRGRTPRPGPRHRSIVRGRPDGRVVQLHAVQRGRELRVGAWRRVRPSRDDDRMRVDGIEQCALGRGSPDGRRRHSGCRLRRQRESDARAAHGSSHDCGTGTHRHAGGRNRLHARGDTGRVAAESRATRSVSTAASSCRGHVHGGTRRSGSSRPPERRLRLRWLDGRVQRPQHRLRTAPGRQPLGHRNVPGQCSSAHLDGDQGR